MYKKLLIIFSVIFIITGCAHLPFFGKNKRSANNPPPPQEEAAVIPKATTGKDNGKFFQTMGFEFFKQNDWENSSICFNKAVKFDHKLYLSWLYLGLMDIDNETGFNYLKKSASIKSDFPIPYYWMAYYQCRKKDNLKAIELFEKYIELAKGKSGEEDRLKAAKKALEELKAGKEGEALALIRESRQ